jgi:4-oxalomesaconate hydratase
MSKTNKPGLLVVAAHPGDFVWRTAGAIAVHLDLGWRALVVCGSYGAKGEAGLLWNAAGATLESVTAARRQEARSAAEVLGVDLLCLELEDYPLVPTTADTIALSKVIRDFEPRVILTHPSKDPPNVDHANISAMVMLARSFAIAPGYGSDMPPPPAIHYFEPHQPEQSDFKADLFLDISKFWQIKRRAFEAIPSQRGVWDYYERVALQRGSQAGRRAIEPVKYAEAYQRAFPSVAQKFD